MLINTCNTLCLLTSYQFTSRIINNLKEYVDKKEKKPSEPLAMDESILDYGRVNKTPQNAIIA